MKRLVPSLAAVLLVLSCGTGARAACSYIVQPGDTLSVIADKIYGDVLAYTALHDANRGVIGPDPGVIEVGQNLQVPCTDAPPAPLSAGAEPLPPLVSPTALAGALADRRVQVLDIRNGDPGGVYLPSSSHVPYRRWRSGPAAAGFVPQDADLSGLLGTTGLDLQAPIVIVSTNGATYSMGAGAWVYWLLKSAGAAQLSLLDGGVKSWRAAGLPLANAPAARPARQISVQLVDTWRASTEDVRALQGGTIAGTLVDSRAGQATPRPGLAGAQSQPAFHLPGAAKGIRDRALDVFSRIKDQPLDWEAEQVIHFCGNGQASALNWFYASQVSGLTNVRLYPEALAGWQAAGGQLVAPPAN